jgi:hypothetical protein
VFLNKTAYVTRNKTEGLTFEVYLIRRYVTCYLGGVTSDADPLP